MSSNSIILSLIPNLGSNVNTLNSKFDIFNLKLTSLSFNSILGLISSSFSLIKTLKLFVLIPIVVKNISVP